MMAQAQVMLLDMCWQGASLEVAVYQHKAPYLWFVTDENIV